MRGGGRERVEVPGARCAGSSVSGVFGLIPSRSTQMYSGARFYLCALCVTTLRTTGRFLCKSHSYRGVSVRGEAGQDGGTAPVLWLRRCLSAGPNLACEMRAENQGPVSAGEKPELNNGGFRDVAWN